MQLLQVEVVERDSRTVVYLIGEIDLSNNDVLVDALDSVRHVPAVVVDLSRLTYLDSAGIRTMVQAQRRADSNGRTLTIRRPTAPVQRILDVLGLTAELAGGASSNDAA